MIQAGKVSVGDYPVVLDATMASGVVRVASGRIDGALLGGAYDAIQLERV